MATSNSLFTNILQNIFSVQRKLRVSKWWQYLHFCVNCPFKFKLKIMWITPKAIFFTKLLTHQHKCIGLPAAWSVQSNIILWCSVCRVCKECVFNEPWAAYLTSDMRLEKAQRTAYAPQRHGLSFFSKCCQSAESLEGHRPHRRNMRMYQISKPC